MKQVHIVLLLSWLSFGFVGTSYSNLHESTFMSSQVQERIAISSAKIKSSIKNEAFQSGLPDALASLGGVGTLVKIDYNRPAKEVIKDVANALVPMIIQGLALIPGGSVISGVVAGVFGLFSGLFGGKVKSPMEKMIDGLRDDIDTMKKQIAEMPEKMRKQTDERLKNIINRAINGQIKRNDYICSKYELISASYVNDMKHKIPINESLRSEMVGHIHNCDNFLKDTASGFVFPEFADVLWVPSAITTLVRISFLAEICSYGYTLHLDPSILRLFWSECQNDIRRHFVFAGQGVKQRLESLVGKTIKNPGISVSAGMNQNLTETEYEGCKIQAQLLYFEREIYPYGVPKPFRINSFVSEVPMTDFSMTTDDPRHVLVYYNNIAVANTDHPDAIFNCIMGPDRIIRLQSDAFTFRAVYVPNKSYQVRILYFAITEEYKQKDSQDGIEALPISQSTTDRNVSVTEESPNSLKITIDEGKPNSNSNQRFVIKTGYHKMKYDTHRMTSFGYYPALPYNFYAAVDGVLGGYVIENVYGFNVLSDAEKNGIITVTNKLPAYTTMLGVELIVLPVIK